MTVVKKLTQMNLTVCATIHSPTPYCFNQFDRLMLLLRGQTVYFGPNGAVQPSGLTYTAAISLGYACRSSKHAQQCILRMLL